MLAHGAGMIGLPLRLLAREIYDRICAVKGPRACALITGEEKVRPAGARYFACTVEAMPVSEPMDFIAVDEIQLATDPDRGHIFTDRLLNARGAHETLLLGADTMRPVLQSLKLDVDTERRERFSQLTYAGPSKITKLPKRSAIVAFSAEEVYAIAELLKRQAGGCAVIMGALSPRTRNAQVDLYQSGDVDYIVATDAIGMGLNLDVGHIAFASRGKFDGRRRRLLRPDEAAQIAGRAGRFRTDGSFGETADCPAFDPEDVERICEHRFDPALQLNWRESRLDWSDLRALHASLRRPSPHPALRRTSDALDEATLTIASADRDIADRIRRPADVRRLWDLCCLPDFRKSGPDAHFRLVRGFIDSILDPSDRIGDSWMFEQVNRLDRTEGDIDTLQQRLAAIRTFTYAANRDDWLTNPEHWRERTRAIEDRLSDALHERLLQRFVDRRTSALLKTLKSEDDTPAEVFGDGEVRISGHLVGRLEGLHFLPDASGQSLEGRALRHAAMRSLAPLLERKLQRISCCAPDALSLRVTDASILFDGEAIARLRRGPSWLEPDVALMSGDELSAVSRHQARERILDWVRQTIATQLSCYGLLAGTVAAAQTPGAARGIAYQLLESGAAIEAERALRSRPPGADIREALARCGVVCGRRTIYLREGLRPKIAALALLLRGVFDETPIKAAPRSASFSLEGGDQGAHWSGAELAACGFIRAGRRAVRADLVERLLNRFLAERRASSGATFAAPEGAAAMIGCPAGEFPKVMQSLGMIPARRGQAPGIVELWRFPAAERAATHVPVVADGPFAALAELRPAAPEQPYAGPRRRPRKKPRPEETA
jgi:ATP-dependent RNA helicase SUPV3L1/SUV3